MTGGVRIRQTTAFFISFAIIASSGLIAAGEADATTYSQEDVVYLTDQTYVSVWSVAVGDTDSDGKKEVLAEYAWYIAPYGIPCLSIYEFDGASYQLEAKIMNVSMGNPGYIGPGRNIAIADMNQDGVNEIIFAGRLNGTAGCYAFEWNGVNYSEIASVVGLYVEIAIGDGDCDSIDELYAVTQNDIDVFDFTGGDFVLSNSWSLSGASYACVSDTDDDSMPEVVIAVGDLDIAFYQWDGAGYSLDGYAYGPPGYFSHGMGVGDLDKDGENEVMRVDYWSTVTVFGWNKSISSYSIEWNGSSNPYGDCVGYGTIGDSDNHGTPEILMGHANWAGGHSLIIFKYSESDKTYVQDWDSGWLDAYVYSITVGDADGDGVKELITGSGAHSNVRFFAAPYTPPPASPPRAAFSVSPYTGTVDTNFTAKATNSYDAETPTNLLMVRWDWEHDGVWDTSWSTNKSATHKFSAIGNYSIALEVIDEDMLTNTTVVNVSVVEDVWAPVTEVIQQGTQGQNCWYKSSVQITLDAVENLSSTSSVHYRINGGSWQTYSGALTVDDEGNTTVEYYSTDSEGNAESYQSICVKIDTSAPVTNVTTSGSTLNITASDSTCGVNWTMYRIDNGTWQKYSHPINVGMPGNHTIEYYSADCAGNVEDIQTTWIDNGTDVTSLGETLFALFAAMIVVLATFFLMIFLLKRGKRRKGGQSDIPPDAQ